MGDIRGSWDEVFHDTREEWRRAYEHADASALGRAMTHLQADFQTSADDQRGRFVAVAPRSAPVEPKPDVGFQSPGSAPVAQGQSAEEPFERDAARSHSRVRVIC
jgi:hypothetical protein